MMKIALVTFVFLSCGMSLSAMSFGGHLTVNWTSEDRELDERGYKIVENIAYKVPDLKDLAASFIILIPFSLN